LNAKDALGKHGEQLAAEYLQQAGFWILDRNWRCAGTGTPASHWPTSRHDRKWGDALCARATPRNQQDRSLTHVTNLRIAAAI